MSKVEDEPMIEREDTMNCRRSCALCSLVSDSFCLLEENELVLRASTVTHAELTVAWHKASSIV